MERLGLGDSDWIGTRIHLNRDWSNLEEGEAGAGHEAVLVLDGGERVFRVLLQPLVKNPANGQITLLVNPPRVKSHRWSNRAAPRVKTPPLVKNPPLVKLRRWSNPLGCSACSSSHWSKPR